MLYYIVGSIIVGIITFYLFSPRHNSVCGLDHPANVYNRWRRLKNSFSYEQFLQQISPIENPKTYKKVLDDALKLKNQQEKHAEGIILLEKVVTTAKDLTKKKDPLGKEILDYINSIKDLKVLFNESVQYHDLMDAFFNDDGWTVDKDLLYNVEYSYRTKGRTLKSRKFIKIVDLPILNVATRCEEIELFNTWKWYQNGKIIKTETSKGTILCSIISILSRFVVLNRAAYCWKINYKLPDGSVIIAYNGANNRQSDYDLPPLPKGFAYPDIFYHAFRLIPLTPTKTILISVMESDPKIWFYTKEMFIRTAKKFGCRELKLIDEHAGVISGTPYEAKLSKSFYKGL
ncbi:hypothetical protein PPL_05116 [Heterostelium album PN500]|uniref:Uncharacterized protein n=1 Tax=Heterostelium pallidum (strain ATCC 26659 / Pp 5 / PN500) TaxID=670386 RepID=D3B9H2_HETP5|nr:hypothetical protein PPL_05116 [Heterostelium album PN500]EFA81884.1 hypothetical protein PPL_05116 [Heterostelium album PN500]|eukprot:XP_020434001.1 hypothetical protein PPL_05116 [Heterostelium album PN500]